MTISRTHKIWLRAWNFASGTLRCVSIFSSLFCPLPFSPSRKNCVYVFRYLRTTNTFSLPPTTRSTTTPPYKCRRMKYYFYRFGFDFTTTATLLKNKKKKRERFLRAWFRFSNVLFRRARECRRDKHEPRKVFRELHNTTAIAHIAREGSTFWFFE